MPHEPAKQPFKWLLLRLRPLLRILKGFRGTPHAIAGGFSLGIFLALTPTVGVQLIIAVFLATVFKVSRPAALIAVMVTNPVTIPPIFTFNYYIGSLFIDGPSVTEVYKHFIRIAADMAKFNVWEVTDQIKAFAETGQEMLLPLILGSLIIATISAIISYIIVVRVLSFLFLHSQRRKMLKEKMAPSRSNTSKKQ